jgi:MFS family permease
MLFNYAIGKLVEPTLQMVLFMVGLPALIILGGRGASRIVMRLKEKHTFPRTGYVSYQPKERSTRWKRVLISVITGLLVGTLTTMIASNIPPLYQQLFVASLISLAYVYVAYVIGLNRFYLIAGLTFVIGLTLAFLHIEESTFFLAFFLGQGLIWMVSGAITLYNYMQTTQPPVESES